MKERVIFNHLSGPESRIPVVQVIFSYSYLLPLSLWYTVSKGGHQQVLLSLYTHWALLTNRWSLSLVPLKLGWPCDLL